MALCLFIANSAYYAKLPNIEIYGITYITFLLMKHKKTF